MHPTRCAVLAACIVVVDAWSAAPQRGLHLRRVAPLRDADRCYYGDIDEDGVVVVDRAKKSGWRIEKRGPSPALSALEAVEQQFVALSSQDLEHAHSFLSPEVVEQYSMDQERFKSVLKGAQFDGLIGMSSWKVTAMNPGVDDDQMVADMTVLPKPVPGCVKISGLAGQQGITWPTFFKWKLKRQSSGPLSGCWTLDEMVPQPPPIDVPKDTPLLASD